MKLVIRTAMIKYFALAVAVFALGLPAHAQSPNVPKSAFWECLMVATAPKASGALQS